MPEQTSGSRGPCQSKERLNLQPKECLASRTLQATCRQQKQSQNPLRDAQSSAGLRSQPGPWWPQEEY